MHVDVVCNTGSGGSAKIHAEIEARRGVSTSERFLRALGKVHQFVRDRFRGRRQISDVLVRNNQKVTRHVGIEIQNCITVPTPVNNIVLRIIFRTSSNFAKDALA